MATSDVGGAFQTWWWWYGRANGEQRSRARPKSTNARLRSIKMDGGKEATTRRKERSSIGRRAAVTRTRTQEHAEGEEVPSSDEENAKSQAFHPSNQAPSVPRNGEAREQPAPILELGHSRFPPATQGVGGLIRKGRAARRRTSWHVPTHWSHVKGPPALAVYFSRNARVPPHPLRRLY